MRKYIAILSFLTLFLTNQSEAQDAVRRPIVRQTNQITRWTTVDPYVGIFAALDLDNPRTTAGFDLRLSMPVFNLGNAALTIHVEGGMLSGTGIYDHVSNLTIGRVMAHSTGALGLRARDRALSVGTRIGYTPWFTVVRNPNNFLTYSADHSVLVGFEIGIGPPEMTMTLSFDVYISPTWLRPVLPVAALGLCF